MSRPAPITPGDLLKEEFLVPMGISQYRLAKEIGVPAQRIGEIIAGRRAVTADTDLRQRIRPWGSRPTEDTPRRRRA